MSLVTIVSSDQNAATVQWNGALTTTAGTVVGETPSGTPNGVLASFTTASVFDGSSIAVFVNGIQATKTIDYTTTGNTITFSYSPATGDIIRVNYKV